MRARGTYFRVQFIEQRCNYRLFSVLNDLFLGGVGDIIGYCSASGSIFIVGGEGDGRIVI